MILANKQIDYKSWRGKTYTMIDTVIGGYNIVNCMYWPDLFARRVFENLREYDNSK